VNGFLIYELFNFFIDLTKELHLAHVFVVTSDSLFIEQIYNEAMLQGRCRYLLVDDFDEATTAAFLEGHGFTDDETRVAWEYCGGKPVYLIELVNCENRKEKVGELLRLRTGEIKTTLKRVRELGGEIRIEDRSYAVNYAELVDALKRFVERDEIDMGEVDEISTTFLVKKNILFVDPLTTMITPQSRLDLIAIREAMGDV
jgi:AAA+ ATPase superfamily predicted ATPase